jgi:membrane-associated phospholipid phosphatase
LAICICFLLLDPLTGYIIAMRSIRGEFARMLACAEDFGTPFGQFLVLATIVTVQRSRFPQALRIFSGAAAAGLMADVIKLFVARVRPRAFDFTTHSLWEGFQGFFLFGAGGHAMQSFPSAHTACAFGFAALLSWAYPTGRPAFFVIAAVTGLQRISVGAHFPSDVCVGAALGWGIGMLFVHWPPVARLFDRVEQYWQSRPASQERSAA